MDVVTTSGVATGVAGMLLSVRQFIINTWVLLVGKSTTSSQFFRGVFCEILMVDFFLKNIDLLLSENIQIKTVSYRNFLNEI